MKLYEIKTNTQYNSNEIYFAEKPSEATRTALKALKFRWNGQKKCWYGFANVDKINEALASEKVAIIPDSSFVDGGGLYDGWEGGNNKTWHDDKELKAHLTADFKKAGIKASIRFNRAGYLTSITCTMTIKEDEIKSLEEYKESFEIDSCCHWLNYKDEYGVRRDIGRDAFYALEDPERTEMLNNIMETEYEMAVNRLTCSGTSHSDYKQILRTSAAERFDLLQKIVTSYNRDCSNSMVDYFDRDIYDHYCFKIA